MHSGLVKEGRLLLIKGFVNGKGVLWGIYYLHTPCLSFLINAHQNILIKIRARGGNHSRFFCQGSWNQLGYGILQLGLGIDIRFRVGTESKLVGTGQVPMKMNYSS